MQIGKRGAIELSTNAIVILIVAIVVIALIVGFVVYKFTAGTSKLVLNEPTPEPDSENPIQTPGGRSAFTFGKAAEIEMVLKVYNPLSNEYNSYYTNSTLLQCTSPSGQTALFMPKLPETIIPAGEIKEIPVLFDAREFSYYDTGLKTKKSEPGKYACQLVMKTKQLWPEVEEGNVRQPKFIEGPRIPEKYMEITIE